MLSALVKQNNIKGLAATYDALAAAYPDTVDALAEKIKYTAGAMSALHENYVCNFFEITPWQQSSQSARSEIRVTATWCATP